MSLGETEGLFKASNPLSQHLLTAPLAFSRGAFYLLPSLRADFYRRGNPFPCPPGDSGNVIRLIDILGNFEYNYKYKEGVIECTNEYKIEIADEIVTSKTLLNTIQYSYDSEGALFNKSITFADGTEQVTDYENPEDGNVIAKLAVNGKTVISHSKDDSFGRTEFEELQLGAGVISRRFEYLQGKATDEHIENEKLKSTPTTHIISRIILSDGRTLCYEYDEEERITKVIDSVGGITEYAYDEMGQLLTETVNGVVINAMTYDNYGNILAKDGKAYSYDAVWKDLLTGIGKETITYDAQGNPTNYLGHTLTWENGRQLKSFDNIQYTYNASGIRNSKTVDGIRHTFVLEDVKILKETYGSHTIETLYNNEDSVCGIIYNGTPYYFLKNLQGDIISITDHTGTVVANYTYDAWGKVLSISGDNIHIGAVNPYRYRGYYYDSEINMYYLQSRYYDPEVGRFVCGDMPELAVLDENVLSHNLFCYCGNDCVGSIDELGFWYYNLTDFYNKAALPWKQAFRKCKKWQWLQRKRYNSLYNREVKKLKKYKKQYKDNCEKLGEFSDYIYNQENSKFADLQYASSTIGDAGCELVAIYNVMLYLGKYQYFPRIISECYMNGLTWLDGYFGTSPGNIHKYFTAHEIPCQAAMTFKTWNAQLKNKKIGILSFWNSWCFLSGLHTVMVVYKNKSYYVYNLFNPENDKSKFNLGELFLSEQQLKEHVGNRFIVGYTF